MSFKSASERLAVALSSRWKTPCVKEGVRFCRSVWPQLWFRWESSALLPSLPETELQPEQKLRNEKPQTEMSLTDTASTWSTFGCGICNLLLSAFRWSRAKAEPVSGRDRERQRERWREPWAAPVSTGVVLNPCSAHLGGRSLSQGTLSALDPGVKGQGGGRDLKRQRSVFREQFDQKPATCLSPDGGESCGVAEGSIRSEC